MQHLTEDGFTLLLAGIVRQAAEDYRTKYHKQGIPDAAAFLVAAGLLVDGHLDARFGTVARTRTGRRSHAAAQVAAA